MLAARSSDKKAQCFSWVAREEEDGTTSGQFTDWLLQFTYYSSKASQWAGVGHLAIAEKGFTQDDFKTIYIDLITGENFDLDYLMINPNGTIPSLTSPFLNEPLTESVDILRFLDQLSDSGATLVPTNPIVEEKVEAILEIVHSQQVDSNIILLQARDTEELQSKQATAGAFLRNRQVKLEKEAAASPSNAFYGPKIKQNMDIYKFFALPISSDHEAFFQKTHNDYQSFAQGVNQLESILVLPYAAGETVTEADFNVIPWLSHCMAAAGTPEHEILNLDVLEKVVQKSVPNFVIGERTMQWWANVSELKAFKEAFPFLH